MIGCFCREKLIVVRHASYVLVVGLLAGLLVGCARDNAASSTELVVFAATSLTDAFTELARAFEQENGNTAVILNFASSSQLAVQLTEGAPADVFASANERQMDVAISAGRVVAADSVPFANNRLTILVPADNPADITVLADLSQPGIQLVLAAPGVPARQYTDEIVAQLDSQFAQSFYANLVSEEKNVRQVAAKVALGEADAAIVYTSDVTPDIADRVQQIVIPDAQNVTAVYPIAHLTDAMHPELAQQFIQFVHSPDGQEILLKWGFGVPGE
jgi:molybdate transport system substrate-binding protein